MIYEVYAVEHDLPLFSLTLILLIQWHNKLAVVVNQIGSSVSYSSEYYFQFSTSQPRHSCRHCHNLI